MIGGNDRYYEGSEDWMSKASDDALFFKLSIPSTHDTCALYDFPLLSSTAAAQDLTLREQLDAGVRGLDIRPYHEKDGSFTIHHGVVYQHMDYQDVLDICYEFLGEHPSECILFTVYNENRTASENEAIAECVLKGIEARGDMYYDVNPSQGVGLRLGDVRGKLVLLKRFDGLEGYGIDKSGYDTKGAPSKTTDLESSYTRLIEGLNFNASTPGSKPTLVFSAGYFKGQFGIPNIRIASSYMNIRLLEYLKDKAGSGATYGPVFCDHITRELSHSIYSVNSLMD